jgi:hypothetical protein
MTLRLAGPDATAWGVVKNERTWPGLAGWDVVMSWRPMDNGGEGAMSSDFVSSLDSELRPDVDMIVMLLVFLAPEFERRGSTVRS